MVQMNLADLFLAPGPQRASYRLRSMACFYGNHWTVFVRSHHVNDKWITVDDEKASVSDGFSSIVNKCARGKQRPAVLFLEREL